MKTIDTLVEDIYGLFTSDFEPKAEELDQFGRKLAEHLSSRIGEQRGDSSLRFSNIGTPCIRKLWYHVNTPQKGEKLRPEVRLKFLMGDIIEELLLFLAAQAGHVVENEQEEVELEGVKGHIDATIDGVVVDSKSASSIAFKKFEEHRLADDDPFGYIQQLQGYRFAKKKDKAAFLVMDKQLGKLTLDIHQSDDKDYRQVVREKKEIVAQEVPPERPFTDKADGKSGNMKIPTICSYCQFKYPCWADANKGRGLRTFLYSTGPRYLTKVAREPDVIEVDKDNNFVERN